ncbi:cytochrome c biogenesis protein ResB [Niallia sp. 01092]|uniref:cytochrome c biogenesis protein ResB n=1 Tax=unclassified Niallia TaxID=2837522 RepID=UPI003FCF9939
MNTVNCQCGHKNPLGTKLCVSCGRVLQEVDAGKIDMRYEGTPRRSQTYNKNIIDKVWNFFSSVKVGVCFIFLLLLASIIGTILPQEMYIPTEISSYDYYSDTYGWFGSVYYSIGFANLYQSWWYLLLIICLSFSLVIASIDRFFPLYRALKHQRVGKHESFYYNQRIFFQLPAMDNDKELEKKLHQLRYHVKKEKQHLLAEKGRFSRWGPYINHLGLLIFLCGAMLRFIPGLYINEVMWIREEQTKQIPGTNGLYYLTNNQFILEVYDKNKEDKVFQQALENRTVIAKNFQTNVTLLQASPNAIAGEKTSQIKLKEANIKVNNPLKFAGYAIYQGDFKLNEVSKVQYKIIDKQSKTKLDTILIHVNNPNSSYTLKNGLHVKMLEYYPDVQFDKGGKPTTKSKIPNNPAFIFEISSAKSKEKERSFATLNQTIESNASNQWKLVLDDVQTKNVSALTVRKDPMLPILFVGGIIFMVGVIQGSYWNHRRVWMQWRNNEIWVAAHTNKNWFALKRELSHLFGDKIDLLSDNTITYQKNGYGEEGEDGKHQQ